MTSIQWKRSSSGEKISLAIAKAKYGSQTLLSYNAISEIKKRCAWRWTMLRSLNNHSSHCCSTNHQGPGPGRSSGNVFLVQGGEGDLLGVVPMILFGFSSYGWTGRGCSWISDSGEELCIVFSKFIGFVICDKSKTKAG
ncbi:unnamed protein product [Ilex paraguariensis]|uniref:Uncharacterized protein n=1 Tax=Ilex paraguariensis TaxID=185542 RepID=A0ABC8R6P3_9AQUA